MGVDHDTQVHDGGRGCKFWLIIVALCISEFLSALDLASIGTALPTIIRDVPGADSFAWVSAAYTITCTSILPISGRLADTFGRRDILLGALMMFAIGSLMCASAHSLNMLIAGRAVQGLGSGGIQSLTFIVLGDIVTLKDRGPFIACSHATYSFASAIGPFIGGAMAQKATWRWLFYLNLPLCGLALGVVFFWLPLRRPPIGNLMQNIQALDLPGNMMIIGSTTFCIIALTWAGVQYPWSSVWVLAPLVIGLMGLIISVLYEVFISSNPSIPMALVSNRTSLSGYIGSFLHAVVQMGVIFYIPTYFQAAKITSPLSSGLCTFPMAISISPAAILQGILISKKGRYKYWNLAGWAFMLIGVGLLSTMGENTPIGVSIPYQIITAFGLGFEYATTFAVLAPLDASLNAQALAFLMFSRTFAQSWAVGVGATVVQNQLQHRLSTTVMSSLSTGEDIAYEIIPQISSFPQPLSGEVREAFARSIDTFWQVLLVFCAVGFLSVFFQKDIPLHEEMDGQWQLDDGLKTKKDGDAKSVVV